MKTIPLFILAIVVIGCGSDSGPETANYFQIDNPYDGIWQDSREVPFRLVLEQTFGADEEPEEEMLGGIRGVTTDDAGNVYILDNQQNRLVSFDTDGAFRWTMGREGEGPGEFFRARSVHWNGEDRLYVGNQSGTRFEIFSTSGEFIESRPTEVLSLTRASLAGFLDPSTMVISEGEPGRVGADVHVVSIERDWMITSTIVINQMDDPDLMRGISIYPGVSIVGGDIVVGHTGKYQFEIYDTEGELKRIVSRNVDDFVRPGVRRTGNAVSVRMYSNLDSPLEIFDGYRLVTARWPENVRDPDEHMRIEANGQSFEETIDYYTIDLYDQNWRLLYAWTLLDEVHEEIGTFYHTDAQGRLYARIRSDYPKVGRYRVEIDER